MSLHGVVGVRIFPLKMSLIPWHATPWRSASFSMSVPTTASSSTWIVNAGCFLVTSRIQISIWKCASHCEVEWKIGRLSLFHGKFAEISGQLSL